jgi:hypothetical protein
MWEASFSVEAALEPLIATQKQVVLVSESKEID